MRSSAASDEYKRQVNNLFGQDYDVVLNYPMPKTNFRFVVSVDL